MNLQSGSVRKTYDKPTSSSEDESPMMTCERQSTTFEYSDVLPFNHFPAEIQTKIFEELSPNDIKKARLVCSSWRKTIDENIHFSVILDDKTFDYQEAPFPPWKIQKFLIRNFQAPLQDIVNFFQYPDTLKKLVVWGPVLPSNFHHILNAAKNLEELDIANDVLWSVQSLWKVNGNIEKISCNRLRKLKIFARAAVIHLSENLLGLFQQSMPNLTKLQIIISGPGYAPQGAAIEEGDGHALTREMNVAFSLVQFIATKRNLKTLHIAIKPHLHVDATQVEQWISQMNTTSNLEHNLRQLKLQILRLCVAPFYLLLLRTLVSGQSKLKDFRVQARFLDQMPLRYSSLEDSIRTSVQTLSSIHLEWLAFEPDTVINFQLFMLANNLTRIIMKRWWKTDANHQNGMATITNLQMLPPTIQDLEIEGFHCNTAELKALAESTNLVPKLNYVRLRHVGCELTPGFGIDGSVTKAFFHMPSLHRLILGPLKYRNFRIIDQEYKELRRKYGSCDFESGSIINFEFGPNKNFKHS